MSTDKGKNGVEPPAEPLGLLIQNVHGPNFILTLCFFSAHDVINMKQLVRFDYVSEKRWTQCPINRTVIYIHDWILSEFYVA